MTLSHVSWSQSQMLQLAAVNELEVMRVMIARLLGDSKTKPDIINPPDVKSNREQAESEAVESYNGSPLAGILTGLLNAYKGKG